ncbi:MAG: DUF2029 domain-containing protein [Chloroflexi bacterium]|nr:DUF2029 domain-containing protein [Chloroflexota bacterium]
MNLRRLDVLLLVVLVTARVRIDTLADMSAPRPVETIRQIGWLAGLLSPGAWKLLEDWLTDPLSLLLISVTFTLVLAHVVVDLFQPAGDAPAPRVFRAKLALVFAIIGTTVIVQSLYLVGLRHVTGPAAYTHDGGVIQTEETIKFILQGKNPYVEDYTKTPMAEWGLDLRTALYHYPYLPWTFLFSTPFYLLSNVLIGWYDQRFVYLLLFVVMLALASRLSAHPTARLVLVMTLGLNPIMGSDVIFGQNDSFVLFWLVATLFALTRRHRLATPAALVLFALACASKPTAWFFAPFIFLYIWRRDAAASPASWRALIVRWLPFIVPFVVIVLPFVLWDPANFYDDVWAWSAGTSPTAYQIRGWGLSNFVLALNLVPSRLAYFPFWAPELLICAPLLAVTAWRQWRENTLANIAWHSAVLLFAFAYTSRFLNENYLGFIVGLLALGLCAAEPSARE